MNSEWLTVKYWSDRWYPTIESRNPVMRFFNKVGECAEGTTSILDIGAGAGTRNMYNLRAPSRKIFGIDVDPRVRTNPNLDIGIVADASKLPFETNSFDLIFAVYVLEHISNPVVFAKEVSRVLKPSGTFLALTPNSWHYVTMISRATPTNFHKIVNRLRGRELEDTFPTCYALNTKTALRHAFVKHAGLTEESIEFIEVQPNYLTFCLPAFMAGSLYERIVNSTSFLSGARVNIMCQFTKK